MSRLRDLSARRRLAREAEQEIEAHLDQLTARYVRAGNTPAEARRLARAKFGGIAQIREELHGQLFSRTLHWTIMWRTGDLLPPRQSIRSPA